MPTIFRHSKIALFSIVFLAALVAQNSPEWTVKPEWIRAHEMFLASDAMRGRGSATPDELIAASYVAAEFEKYGLKPGMLDGTYIQRVELIQPVENGKTKITSSQSGFASLEEGRDFRFQRSSAENVTGPLQKLSADNAAASIQPGGIILLSGDVGRGALSFMRRAYSAGAK